MRPEIPEASRGVESEKQRAGAPRINRRNFIGVSLAGIVAPIAHAKLPTGLPHRLDAATCGGGWKVWDSTNHCERKYVVWADSKTAQFGEYLHDKNGIIVPKRCDSLPVNVIQRASITFDWRERTVFIR